MTSGKVVGLIVAMVAVIVAFVILSRLSGPGEEQAEEVLRQASLLQARGDSAGAEAVARRAVALNPRLALAHRLAADCAIDRGDFSTALQDLSKIEAVDRDNWLAAKKLAADLLHHKVFRLRDAEQAYRDVLDVAPDDTFANDGYARLLGLCGRRQEAIPHVLRLIRASEDTDLLMLLSRESGLLTDPELLNAAHQADPEDPNPLLGQAAAAASSQQPELALEKLRQAKSLRELPKNFHGLLGQQLLANDQVAELDLWVADFSEQNASVEAWLVLAELADRVGDFKGSIRCLWEAVRRRPESLSAMNQLARRLTSSGHPELAAPFQKRVRQINDLRDQQQRAIMSTERPKFDDVLKMVQAYATVGRLWEAYGWGTAALGMSPTDAELQQLLQQIAVRLPELPLVLTVAELNPALQTDLSHYPIPRPERSFTDAAADATSNDITFRSQGSDIGFDFRYFDGSVETTRRMFEFSGGGLAVIDFDNDACPDLLCTQGRLWEPAAAGNQTHHDCLFRNRRGQAFAEVSQLARVAQETGFGQGAATGDVNNDGFADLYIANTQTNQLWINNGDGTFSDRSSVIAGSLSDWTTSCLVADLNGDTFPDLYDVNYLSGDDVFDRTCTEEHGDTIMCAPYDFAAATDRVWLGDGTGGFVPAAEFLNPPPAGKGLGIVAFRNVGQRLSLFVSNDTTANFLYAADSPTATMLTECAVSHGLAFNGDGKAEACMGIAAADCTQDGQLDFLVTNFLYESNTLYSTVTPQLFEDQTRSLGLHESTLPVLGFGTQFLDVNRDGRYELFVANGFTQDLSKYDTPYRMKPQLFEWMGSKFHSLPEGQPGPWSALENVGRAVAKWDWNVDGQADLVVGLLDDASYILTNSSTSRNHSLSLTLIATTTARDAIGTIVTATIDGQTFVHQLTAGDGYQCSNERRLIIGCGSATGIDHLTIDWPSGTRQKFADIAVSQSAVIIEGRSMSEQETVR